MIWAIFLTAVLLVANAFFVAAEFSLISSRKDRLESLIEGGNRRALTVKQATEDLSVNLAAAQFGITLASVILGKVGEPAIAHMLETPAHQLGLPDNLLHPVSFVVALSLITVLHIIIGEMVPKNIALAGPESVAMLVSPFHTFFGRITRPFVVGLNWISAMILKMFGIEQQDELDSTVNPQELASMISQSRSEGLLDAEEHSRLRRALASPKRQLSEIMITADNVRSLKMSGKAPTVGELEDAVTETGYSRFPITGRKGTYLGYVHVKDVLDRELNPNTDRDSHLARAEIRSLMSLTPTMTISEGLREMRANSRHMAQVVDGGVQIGIVTLEDLIEEYVGTVRDNTHDDE